MPIDACPSTFAELAAVILPSHMAKLRQAMTTPFRLADFSAPGVGAKTFLKGLGRSKDFSGCYLILDGSKPMYVGISRRVVHRLQAHCKGNSHFSATLAYSMAKGKLSQGSVGEPREMTRDAAMKDVALREAFNTAKQVLRNCNVAFIEIPNPVELYLFEVYAALEFDTGEWNTFRTH
jgi:predicted GIY-YIG superfamily endonuclease